MTNADWARLKHWFEDSTEGSAQDARRAMDEAEAASPELADQLRGLLRDTGRRI
jgi:hypothetical protein